MSQQARKVVILDSKGNDALETIRKRARAILTGAWNPEQPDIEPGWIDALNQITPVDFDGVESFLWLYWEEGYPWEPVNRWMIGQVTPWKRVPPFFRMMLEEFGDPRQYGHWDSVLKEYMYDGPAYTRRTWDFYDWSKAKSLEGAGSMLVPYWVVQGSSGGHKKQLTHWEVTQLEIHDSMPDEWPEPGDLPFAPPNDATFAKIRQGRRVQKLMDCLIDAHNANVVLDTEEQDIAERMRAEVWEWLNEQAEEAASELEFCLRSDWNMLPSSDEDPVQEYDRARQAFIERGV